MASDTKSTDLTPSEAERIAWLTKQNMERLGKRHHKAALAMAIAQVELERAASEPGKEWLR